VFIREDWEEVCRDGIPELLRPVLTHHVAERYRAQHDPKRRILYPHRMEGKKRHPVDLSRYPNTERYLSLHRERLSSREYLRESGRAWYELWVPHDPTVWNRTKLVWRDIVEHPTFWIDEHEAVVNGDCYWMVCDTAADERLLWLAVAVGNSSFVEVFYDKMFNNRLYARRRRFITQYVEKFPLPDPTTTIAAEIIDTARRVYLMKQHSDTSAQENAIDHLVWNAFGMEKPRTPTLRAAELETPPPS
jgi:adenine-specific DNA-methyltransferase